MITINLPINALAGGMTLILTFSGVCGTTLGDTASAVLAIRDEIARTLTTNALLGGLAQGRLFYGLGLLLTGATDTLDVGATTCTTCFPDSCRTRSPSSRTRRASWPSHPMGRR